MKIHVEHDGYYGWVPSKGGLGDTTVQVPDAVGQKYLTLSQQYFDMAYELTKLVEGRDD